MQDDTIDPTVSPVYKNPVIAQIVKALREVQLVMRSKTSKRDLSSDLFFPDAHLSPIMYDLLSMLNDSRSPLEEAFRLAGIIFVHELQ